MRRAPQGLNRLLRDSADSRQSPSEAKAGAGVKLLNAAVNRCATQKQGQGKVLLFRLLSLILVLVVAMPAQQGQPAGQSQASIGAAPVRIEPPRPNYPFPDGRSYVYSAEWHLITAGTGVVRMEVAGNGRKVIATAESSGAVNVIFPVHDHFEAHFDPRTFCSLSIFKHSEEGAHKRETSIHFDYARKKSTLDEKNLKTGETKHVENDLDSCATDVITGFYYVQSLPLKMGATYEFPISDGKTAIVRATVEKREQVKVPAGTFSTVLVSAEAISGSLKSKGKVWAWFSDDASHTPVQMRAKLGWGTLLFRLQRIDK
jgi:hypothetical protein